VTSLDKMRQATGASPDVNEQYCSNDHFRYPRLEADRHARPLLTSEIPRPGGEGVRSTSSLWSQRMGNHFGV
jgi:hypothetical protein